MQFWDDVGRFIPTIKTTFSTNCVVQQYWSHAFIHDTNFSSKNVNGIFVLLPNHTICALTAVLCVSTGLTFSTTTATFSDVFLIAGRTVNPIALVADFACRYCFERPLSSDRSNFSNILVKKQSCKLFFKKESPLFLLKLLALFGLFVAIPLPFLRARSI